MRMLEDNRQVVVGSERDGRIRKLEDNIQGIVGSMRDGRSGGMRRLEDNRQGERWEKLGNEEAGG